MQGRNITDNLHIHQKLLKKEEIKILVFVSVRKNIVGTTFSIMSYVNCNHIIKSMMSLLICSMFNKLAMLKQAHSPKI